MNRETFDRLVVRELPVMQRFAVRLTGRVDMAEEIVQAALLRAHRGRAGFAGAGSLRTWLLRIVVNAFRDDLDHRAIRQVDPLDEQAPDRGDNDPATLAESAEMGRIVAAAVSNLPARQREVIVLHTYEQLTDTEIAAVLQINPQNVRTTLHLARQRLKEMLRVYLSDGHAAK